MDYVDYGQRDMFFGGQGNPSSTSRPPMTPSNSFPPIGTFTLDSATMAAPQSQNTVFGGGDTMSVLGGSGGTGTIGVFSSNTIMSGSGSGGGSGNSGGPSGGISGGNSSNSYGGGSQSNSNGVDANQGTRETGIIEKLLVRFLYSYTVQKYACIF